MQQKVGKISCLLLACLRKTLGCFTFYTQTCKRDLSWEVQRQQGKWLMQWTWVASRFLWVLAGICAAKCLNKGENCGVLHMARTKEEEKTKHIGAAKIGTMAIVRVHTVLGVKQTTFSQTSANSLNPANKPGFFTPSQIQHQSWNLQPAKVNLQTNSPSKPRKSLTSCSTINTR